MRANILKVVVAAGGVRFVCARSEARSPSHAYKQGDRENRRQSNEAPSLLAGTLLFVNFQGHSIANYYSRITVCIGPRFHGLHRAEPRRFRLA
jgi:hypothetical protein